MDFNEICKKALAKIKDVAKKWDRKFINDLPDSAFAVIVSGGEKDDEGKTTPRSLRKLPHHDGPGDLGGSHSNKNVDLAHLRNALSRLPQTKLSDADRKKAEAHLNWHKKTLLDED